MYNAFDLIEIYINNKMIYGRPVAFDSDIVDFNNMTNAFGAIVKPTRLSTTCPDCGQGLLIDAAFENPPFSLSTSCYICKPTIANDIVITNPIVNNKIKIEELDPTISHVSQQSESTETVAERIEKTKEKEKEKEKSKSKTKSSKKKAKAKAKSIDDKIKDPEKDYKKNVEWDLEKQTYASKLESDEDLVSETLEDLLNENVENEEFADDDMVE